ncbi:MAG: phosphotyrosine protein phosphatase [Robiginitomaculum sp.]|nr:MAG: phosphotyrosine protein phosphatase [Robiginitomaculum sp.]
MTRLLFVCLGNICRSPTAEAVFRGRAKAAGHQVLVSSAGTMDWHVGKHPDPRAIAAAAKRGYQMSRLQAQVVQVSDFSEFDYILAMDRQNLADLEQIYPGTGTRPRLFLDYATHTGQFEVPDPYYGGEDGFSEVLDLIEAASDGLLSTFD